MNSDVTSDIPPTPPKTAGRKKIKIQRIEDSRNRQVTFLKRKNGLLKKAMELGILCDCEVTVIIFNLNNGKLFEYSSVDPETVLQKYATYSGPSERRRKDKFFELSASKGTSNIPINEPRVAKAAMDAATAAARRPRPFHKFRNSENEGDEDMYCNGRKLSSGESPGNPSVPQGSSSHVPAQLLPATAIAAPNVSTTQVNGQPHMRLPVTNSFVPMQWQASLLDDIPSVQNNKPPKVPTLQQSPPILNQHPMQTNAHFTSLRQNASTALSHGQEENNTQYNLQRQLQPPISATNTVQGIGLDLSRTKPSGMAFTPRFTAEVSVPPIFTPSSAGRHLSAILGLTTPTNAATPGSKLPFASPPITTDLPGFNVPLSTPRVVEPERMVNADTEGSRIELQQLSQPKLDSGLRTNQTHYVNPQLGAGQEANRGHFKHSDSPTSYTGDSATVKNMNGQAPKDVANEAKSDSGPVFVSSASNEKAVTKSGSRIKPNLKVAIPNSNRDDLTAVTPSGLVSTSFPTNGSDLLPGLGPTLGSSRLPSISPTGQGIWSSGWHPFGSGDRELLPMPLTPFLNDNFDSFRDGHDPTFGAGHSFSLPSPTNAGLIPLTPRYLGFDPLVSARGDPSSAMPPKRTFEQAFESDVPTPKPK